MCSFGSCQTRFKFLSQFRKVRNAFECFVTQVQTRLPKTKCVWPMKINVICTVCNIEWNICFVTLAHLLTLVLIGESCVTFFWDNFMLLSHVYLCLPHVYLCLPHVYLCLPHVYLCLPHVYLRLPHVYLCLPHVYLCLPHVYLCLPHVYLCLPHVYLCFYPENHIILHLSCSKCPMSRAKL